MVSRCANPQCALPFRYLREGKLFAFPREVGTRIKAVDLFWLCSACSQLFQLIPASPQGATLVQTTPGKGAARYIEDLDRAS